MLNLYNIRECLKQELRFITKNRLRFIMSMIAGAFIIISSWICFDGPCRISLIFHIPGGGFTIATYYILWFIIFAVAGIECTILLSLRWQLRNSKAILYFIASHFCMLLWYPLFFTTFSQFFALILIITGIVLVILEAGEVKKLSSLIFLACIIKIVILIIFSCINISFMIIN